MTRPAYDRVPVRVALRGARQGWHYVIVDQTGAAERHDLGGTPGGRWPPATRPDADPAWWEASAEEIAADLREYVELTVTDLCFERFGVDAAIAWRPCAAPGDWDGAVTLEAPVPGRSPGQVPPFVVELRPGHGAVLPGGPLPFGTPATDTWAALAAVSAHCGTPPPRASFVCGWADHRSVRVGRGHLAMGTEHDEEGVERLGEIHAVRSTGGWGGSPELRVRLEGIDLLHEPAPDVLWLLGELGHRAERRGRTWRVRSAGLTLHPRDDAAREPGAGDRFAIASLTRPALRETRLR